MNAAPIDRVRSRADGRRGFTLAELLVVMGIIAVLGVLTAVSVQRISRDARVSSATNAVTATLASARALAIRDNAVVVVAFRPVWDPANRQRPQQTEMVTAVWSGESIVFTVDPNTNQRDVADRFVPANGIQPVRLPAGIKVAGPLFEDGLDNRWVVQAELAKTANCSESIVYGRQIGVMFAPDGSVVTRNPTASSADTKTFVDFNLTDLSPGDNDPQDVAAGGCASGDFQRYWMQDDPSDECNLTLVPYIAVYDDRLARERRATDWSNESDIVAELVGPTGWISTFADRIHFNRYTGVANVQGAER